MAGYNNRLNGGVCVPCSVGSKPTVVPEPEQNKEDKKDLACCKEFKITAITRVKDKVIVMLDDCTFLMASSDVIDDDFVESSPDALASKAKKLEEQVKELSEKYKTLVENLEDVSDFSGNVRFKAIKNSFNG